MIKQANLYHNKTDHVMEEFNSSLHLDKRLYAADIFASQAYARALGQAGLVAAQEADLLVNGLEQVRKEWAQGVFKIVKGSDHDIHTANERRLGEILEPNGAVAGKLHTGRSRNDQIVTDMRLWTRSAVVYLRGLLTSLIETIKNRASKEIDHVMPGYTHLQRAQPIRWSHFLLSHAFAFQADVERLDDVYKRVNQMPLGLGALAGNQFSIDREFLARELGFDNVQLNSLHGVSDRDFVSELLFIASMIMIHISKFAEDLIIFSTSEFGFVSLADAYSTENSIMPHKRDPNSLELLRGKVGHVFGHLSGFLMTCKGLPSTYNKDLQEDKLPLFDAVDTLDTSLQILTSVVDTLIIHSDNMRKAVTAETLASGLADYLIRKGIPSRTTHHIASAAIAAAEARKISLSELDLHTLQMLHPAFEEDVSCVFNVEQAVDKRSCIGGTARDRVVDQMDALSLWIDNIKSKTPLPVPLVDV